MGWVLRLGAQESRAWKPWTPHPPAQHGSQQGHRTSKRSSRMSWTIASRCELRSALSPALPPHPPCLLNVSGCVRVLACAGVCRRCLRWTTRSRSRRWRDPCKSTRVWMAAAHPGAPVRRPGQAPGRVLSPRPALAATPTPAATRVKVAACAVGSGCRGREREVRYGMRPHGCLRPRRPGCEGRPESPCKPGSTAAVDGGVAGTCRCTIRRLPPHTATQTLSS